jgi:hypothetical protein
MLVAGDSTQGKVVAKMRELPHAFRDERGLGPGLLLHRLEVREGRVRVEVAEVAFSIGVTIDIFKANADFGADTPDLPILRL